MIIDSLRNIGKYQELNPYFAKAFAFMKEIEYKKLEIGNIEIDKDNIFATIAHSKLKDKESASLEAHRKYIDIQIPISNMEMYGWKTYFDCENIAIPYNKEKDIEFYVDEPTTIFKLNPGEFVIFFPEDAHAPCIGEGELEKIIIKVKV